MHFRADNYNAIDRRFVLSSATPTAYEQDPARHLFRQFAKQYTHIGTAAMFFATNQLYGRKYPFSFVDRDFILFEKYASNPAY